MQNLKDWRKISLIVFVSWIVNILLHQIIPITQPDSLASSVVIEQGLLLPVAGSAVLMTLGALAVVFVLLQENLPGKKLAKGLWYGVLFGGLWLIGFLEVSFLWNTSFVTEVFNWLPDGLSIICMSLLLGAFTARDGDPAPTRITPALVVAAFYFVGRYLSYWVLRTNAAYDVNSLAVFVWTLAMALWVGVMYAALAPGSRGHSTISRALWFGGLVFGIDWLVFNLFALVFVDVSALNLIVRSVLDVFFVTLGVFVIEKLADRTASPVRETA